MRNNIVDLSNVAASPHRKNGYEAPSFWDGFYFSFSLIKRLIAANRLQPYEAAILTSFSEKIIKYEISPIP